MEIASIFGAPCSKCILFNEEDFDNNGHEVEVVIRIGLGSLEKSPTYSVKTFFTKFVASIRIKCRII